MSEQIIEKITSMLNEEQWTRALISSYSKNNFVELSSLIEEIKRENCVDEVKTKCDEHLAHAKNSIIALYLSGMISLQRGSLDISPLVSLIDIFQENHKGNIVEYLCEAILDEDSANRFALRKLADCYRETGDDRIWNIYERIVKIDHEEADLAKLLAEHYEKLGDMETAIDYYKKALHRFVKNKSESQVKEMWSKLAALIPDEIDFFYLVDRTIEKTISKDKSAVLLQELYGYYKDKQDWDTAIGILKRILEIDEKDNWARKELVECFRGKYAGHSHLEEYIRISSLGPSFRNVNEAISDFEKHIAFDAKNYVFHRTWGVGIIKSVEGDILTVNFGKKNGVREISLKMAVNALQPLNSQHIWVLKATQSKEQLARKVKEDKVWALKTIIRSFNNKCDFKRIKAELVPSILTQSEWTSWNAAARRILESDAAFGIDPSDITLYTVRDRAISQEEKLSNEFKAQKQFFARIDILMKFNEEADTESELFADMFSYFVGYLKSFKAVNEQVIASFLVVRRIVSEHPHLNPNIQYTFAQLFDEIENPQEMYLALKDTKNTSLRRDFLSCIRKLLPNWVDVYIELFPTVLQDDMLTSLLNDGQEDKVRQLAVCCFEDYRNYREAVVYFINKCSDKDWFMQAGISYEKQLITLIHILALAYREIENHVSTVENKKIEKQIIKMLFSGDTLLNYMLDHDADTITRLYTLVDDVKELDPAIKNIMRNRIQEKYPDFKFFSSEQKTVAPVGLIVTARKMNEKKQELERYQTVEIPANSKEIGDAIALGDLSENAEYKAARERQSWLNSRVAKLQEEISEAQVFDPAMVTTSRVSFGTEVTWHDNITDEDKTYTILGPWESFPAKNIISYRSPLGGKLLDAKEGETRKFTANDHEYDITIKSIKIADF